MTKSTRPHYNTAEIRDLYEKLKDTSNLEPEVRSSLEECIAQENIPKEELYGFPVKSWEAFQNISYEAYSLEAQARALRKIAKSFRCPMKDVGKLINNENETIKQIAIWRLSLGR